MGRNPRTLLALQRCAAPLVRLTPRCPPQDIILRRQSFSRRSCAPRARARCGTGGRGVCGVLPKGTAEFFRVRYIVRRPPCLPAILRVCPACRAAPALLKTNLGVFDWPSALQEESDKQCLQPEPSCSSILPVAPSSLRALFCWPSLIPLPSLLQFPSFRKGNACAQARKRILAGSVARW